MIQHQRSAILGILLLLGTGVAGYAETEVLYGRVVIDAVRGYGMGIALDQRSSTAEPDGTFDRLFVLEKVGLIPDEFPITIDNARLLVRDDGLVATSRNKPLVLGFFQNDNARTTEEQVDSLVMEFGGRSLPNDALFVYSGFGFSRASGKWTLPLDSTWMGPPLTEGQCKSGGLGSTSCSTTCPQSNSCSVSCGTGYYSCCNCGFFVGATCSCTANPGGAGGSGAGGGIGGGGGASQCGVPAGGFCPVACLRCTLVF